MKYLLEATNLYKWHSDEMLKWRQFVYDILSSVAILNKWRRNPGALLKSRTICFPSSWKFYLVRHRNVSILSCNAGYSCLVKTRHITNKYIQNTGKPAVMNFYFVLLSNQKPVLFLLSLETTELNFDEVQQKSGKWGKCWWGPMAYVNLKKKLEETTKYHYR